MFDVGRETLALPLEEKFTFEQGDQGFSFGSVSSLVRTLSNSPHAPAVGIKQLASSTWTTTALETLQSS